LLKRTFLTLLRDLRLDLLRLDLLRLDPPRLDPLRLDPLRLDLLRLDLLRLDLLRLAPPRIAIALEDDKGEGVGFSATPVIFFFRLPKDSVIVSNTPIYILYVYFKNTF
jgi:hypothetical protein